MKSLCILLPVYNGVNRVEYNLKSIYEQCKKYHIDILICDSGIDDCIKQMYMREFSSSENVMYVRNESERKVIDAFKYLSKKYNYVWLIGDNCILDIDYVVPIFKKYSCLDIDILHFCNYGNNITPIRSYNDPVELYKHEAWHLTTYGSYAISSKLLEVINWEEARNRFSISFFVVMAIFTTISCMKINVVTIQGDFYRDNPYRIASSWILNGTAIDVFAKQWVIDNTNLPTTYDGLKAEVIKSHDNNTHIFGLKHLFMLRAYGNVTIRKVIRFYKYIKCSTNTPMICFFAISLIPRFVAKGIYDMRKGIIELRRRDGQK